jgi:hypothetical protein
MTLTHASLPALIIATLWVGACNGNRAPLPPVTGELAIGAWGGDNANFEVLDSVAHVHVGCTFGDVPGRIRLDAGGRFSVAGSYLLRAYPVAIGPSMPAQFAGTVTGADLTFTVTVNDTIEHKATVLGPVTVRFRQNAQMGPCPICVKTRAGT